jgi:hypothetical protein
MNFVRSIFYIGFYSFVIVSCASRSENLEIKKSFSEKTENQNTQRKIAQDAESPDPSFYQAVDQIKAEAISTIKEMYPEDLPYLSTEQEKVDIEKSRSLISKLDKKSIEKFCAVIKRDALGKQRFELFLKSHYENGGIFGLKNSNLLSASYSEIKDMAKSQFSASCLNRAMLVDYDLFFEEFNNQNKLPFNAMTIGQSKALIYAASEISGALKKDFNEFDQWFMIRHLTYVKKI